MGRIRTIKPELLTDAKAVRLSDTAWRLYVSCWLLADDHGRFPADPMVLAGSVFPGRALDESSTSPRRALDECSRAGFLRLYRVRGQLFAEIANWAKHQRIDRPSGPKFPAPCEGIDEPSSSPRRALATDHDHDHDLDLDRDPDREGDPGEGGRAAPPPAIWPEGTEEEASPQPALALSSPETPAGPPELPGERRLPAARRAILRRHLNAALALWELQGELRQSAAPRSGSLKPTAERVLRVAERLEAGASVEECEAVLRHYAAEATSKPESAQWFNGETNWRPDNFDRALGRVGAPAARRIGGSDAPKGYRYRGGEIDLETGELKR